MKFFKNADIYIEGVGIIKSDLLFGDRIAGFNASDGERIKLPDGCTVLPAFIDEHVHGAEGADASDGGDAVIQMSSALPKEGTAYFLPTAMTIAKSDLIKAVREGGEAIKLECAGAKALGFHLEGPFISPKHVGAQHPDYVLPPDTDFLQELIDASGDCIKMITLAPEQPGADKLVRYAVGSGIRVSVGHSDATYAQTVAAVEMGADGITHTFNAQRGLHHREGGVAGAALNTDGLYAELIADGIHVSAPVMQILAKIKPNDKLILITDAIRAKGLPDGESSLGGQKVIVKDGRARLDDGTLAGSVLRMDCAVKNTVKYCGVGLQRACDYASANPARRLGLFGELGGIKVGKRASFTVLDKDLDCVMTIRDGEIIYDRGL